MNTFDLRKYISEGRVAKLSGGKVVTENDYDTGGYVESMGPKLDRAIDLLMRVWEEWKNGPMTEPGMVPHAKTDLINYISQTLENNIQETAEEVEGETVEEVEGETVEEEEKLLGF